MPTDSWPPEENRVEFDAEGLRCVMIRHDVWCGYVGVPSDHPWHGLPRNSIIKPTKTMLERHFDQGMGPFDLMIHALSGRDAEDGIEICMALHVHGGVTWAEDHVPNEEPDGLWWFGFDCGHAGDLNPAMNEQLGREMLKSFMPPETFAALESVFKDMKRGVWRDQQYVVSECQSLAAQLAAIKVDTSDISEADAAWFDKAKLHKPE